MSQLVALPAPSFPALIAAAGDRAQLRFLEFFASNIRNPHTRRAYVRTVAEFLDWCAAAGVASIIEVESLHVAAWIERQTRRVAAPTVKQQLAAIRHLFDWLVTSQIVPVNPAASVRGPSHVVKTGKTPVLDAEEARRLLASIDTGTHAGLRDRALIALMVYSFARIGAALGMKVEDVYTQNRRLWVRLREKGGKRHEMPCHHNLEEYLVAYLDGADLRDDPKGPLFRTIGRGTGELTARKCAAIECSSKQRNKRGPYVLLGNMVMHKTQLIDAIIVEMDRVWGSEGLNGEPDEYAWLLENYGISKEKDVLWQLILEYDLDELTEEDREDREIMEFLEDDQAVVKFLSRLLAHYQSASVSYPHIGSSSTNTN